MGEWSASAAGTDCVRCEGLGELVAAAQVTSVASSSIISSKATWTASRIRSTPSPAQSTSHSAEHLQHSGQGRLRQGQR